MPPSAPTTPGRIRRNSFPNMKRFAEAHKFPFPYLHDEDQSVARAYGAVCTPDFFGFDACWQAQVSRPPRRRPHQPAAGRRTPRAGRGHARHRRDGRRAGAAKPLGRLLHQVEGGVTRRVRSKDRAFTATEEQHEVLRPTASRCSKRSSFRAGAGTSRTCSHRAGGRLTTPGKPKDADNWPVAIAIVDNWLPVPREDGNIAEPSVQLPSTRPLGRIYRRSTKVFQTRGGR